jgi:hypothetical protein
LEAALGILLLPKLMEEDLQFLDELWFFMVFVYSFAVEKEKELGKRVHSI